MKYLIVLFTLVTFSLPAFSYFPDTFLPEECHEKVVRDINDRKAKLIPKEHLSTQETYELSTAASSDERGEIVVTATFTAQSASVKLENQNCRKTDVENLYKCEGDFKWEVPLAAILKDNRIDANDITCRRNRAPLELNDYSDVYGWLKFTAYAFYDAESDTCEL